MVRGTKQDNPKRNTFAHLELSLAGGRYSIAIDKERDTWVWQTGHSDTGKPETFHIIDRGTADTYRQAVHRSMGTVLNHGEAPE